MRPIRLDATELPFPKKGENKKQLAEKSRETEGLAAVAFFLIAALVLVSLMLFAWFTNSFGDVKQTTEAIGGLIILFHLGQWFLGDGKRRAPKNSQKRSR